MPRKRWGNRIKVISSKSIIYTTNEAEIIVDTEDLEELTKYTWALTVTKSPKARIETKYVNIQDFLMKPKKGQQVIHKDGNNLNNSKRNLIII